MKLIVLHRKVKNQRLAAVGYLWTLAALRLSTGARAHYDRRRVAGDRHTAVQRHLFNRFLGCLYYCLQTGQTYAEDQAFPATQLLAAWQAMFLGCLGITPVLTLIDGLCITLPP